MKTLANRTLNGCNIKNVVGSGDNRVMKESKKINGLVLGTKYKSLLNEWVLAIELDEETKAPKS